MFEREQENPEETHMNEGPCEVAVDACCISVPPNETAIVVKMANCLILLVVTSQSSHEPHCLPFSGFEQKFTLAHKWTSGMFFFPFLHSFVL